MISTMEVSLSTELEGLILRVPLRLQESIGLGIWLTSHAFFAG